MRIEGDVKDNIFTLGDIRHCDEMVLISGPGICKKGASYAGIERCFDTFAR